MPPTKRHQRTTSSSVAIPALTRVDDIRQPPQDSLTDVLETELVEPGKMPRIPGYELIRELGRGGMGIVYLARQETLNRFVALKMLRAGFFADADAVQRFQREGEAVAQLHHPHIVQVYELGSVTLEVQGVLPYMALEYINGPSLDTLVAGKPLPAREAAQLLLPLAEAMQTAHEKGILHRDLKPANVLLMKPEQPPKLYENLTDSGRSVFHSSLGIPKLTDFGLAKFGAAHLTTDSMVLGTPNYLAPEQSMGGTQVGPAVDVYGLGAIFYECLTGRAPFPGTQPLEVIRQVQLEEPATPSQLGRTVPRDAETICMKCLRKEPHRRYPSAAALADDLRRFLNGEPITARRVGTVERWWSWSRRNPVVASLVTTVVVLFLLGFVLVSWQAVRASREWERAEQREKQTAQAQRLAQHESARAALDLSIALCEKGDLDYGLLEMACALDLITKIGDPELEQVARINLATWHRQLLQPRALLPHKDWVWTVAFSPDQQTVLTGSADGTAQRWEAATGKPLGEPLRHPYPVWAVAFSPDGKTILTGCGDRATHQAEFRLWEAATGKPRGVGLKHPGAVLQVAFLPDGKEFLVASQVEVVFCQTATGQPLAAPLRHGTPPVPIHEARLSPGGKLLATVGTNDTVQLWDVATRKPHGAPLQHPQCRIVAFAPEGKTLITGGFDAMLRHWEVASGRLLSPPMPQSGPVKTLAFSPQGQLLAVSCLLPEPWTPKSGKAHPLAGEVRLWQTQPLLPQSARIRHPEPVWSLAFSPDGQLLLTGCEDGRTRFWNITDQTMRGQPMLHNGTVISATFNAEGTLVATGDAGGGNFVPGRLREVRTPLVPGKCFPHPTKLHNFCLSPQGNLLLSSTEDGAVHFWDTDKVIAQENPQRHGSTVTSLGFSADGRLYLTKNRTEGVRLWEQATRRQVYQLDFSGDEVSEAALTPEGRHLVVGTTHGFVHLYDTQSKEIKTIIAGGPRITALGMSPHGLLVLTAYCDGRVLLSEREPNKFLPLLHHRSRIPAFAFSPNSKTLATGTDDGVVQLWDVQSGRPLGLPMLHLAEIHSLAFSPDGRTLAVGTTGHTARLWDTATSRPLTPPLRLGGRIQVAFPPTGRHFATTRADYMIQFWEMPTPVTGTAEQIQLWVQVLTGMELDAQGAVRPLDPAVRETRRQQLKLPG
jgi:WD40 repeat protein/predicted Ser/Thr protein kinase